MPTRSAQEEAECAVRSAKRVRKSRERTYRGPIGWYCWLTSSFLLWRAERALKRKRFEDSRRLARIAQNRAPNKVRRMLHLL